jgi:hypothetical protein
MITIVKRGGKTKIQVKIPRLKLKELTPRQIDEALKILVTDIKRHTPVDTGKLRGSIRKKKTATGGEIYLNGKRNNEVAEYLIEGTKSHWVRPKKKKVLAWFTGSGMAFSKGHKVKGIRKGYWKFQPTKSALTAFMTRIKTFLKSK